MGRICETIGLLNLYSYIVRKLFPYKSWIRIRDRSMDEHGEKLCYCGHTYKCSCSNPSKKMFEESVANGDIVLWDKENGWKEVK